MKIGFDIKKDLEGIFLNNNNGFIHYWMLGTEDVRNGYLNFGKFTYII